MLLLVPAVRLVLNSLLLDGHTPQPQGEQGSTVCLKEEETCTGHPCWGPAVQAALAGTDALCSTGKLNPRRVSGQGWQ